MTTPSSALPIAGLIDYASSLGRRLLQGSGSASLVAYRHDAQRSVKMLTHGVTNDGRVVMAALADELPDPDEGGFDVRVDLTREATVPEVRILAATAHLLGWFVPLDPELVAEHAAEDNLPESVRAIAAAPGVIVGFLQARRMLLHQGCGVVPLDLDELLNHDAAAYPTGYDELEAYDTVASSVDLSDLHAAVIAGELPGRILSSRPTPEGSHTCGRVHLVDVDTHGMTLMRVAQTTTVLFVPFSDPVHNAAELAMELFGIKTRS